MPPTTKLKDHIDIMTEIARMRSAVDVRVGHEAIWWRNGRRLDGPFGKLVTAHIQNKFSSGAGPDKVDSDGNPVKGIPRRWDQFYALTDLSDATHPIRQADRALSLLYRKPVQISGDIAGKPWNWLRDRCDLDRVMIRKQSLLIRGGSVVVRPTLREWANGSFYPPGLTTVTPDECIAIEDPGNPGQAAIYLERVPDTSTRWTREYWTIIDVSDPSNPSYGHYRTPDEWLSGVDALEDENGQSTLRIGADFPWFNGFPGASEPVMPAVCSQWDPAATELLPVNLGDTHAMLDLMMARSFAALVTHTGAYQKAVVLSDSDFTGMEQAMIDPTVMIGLVGQGLKDLKIIPDSVNSAVALHGMVRDRWLEWAQKYDTGFEVRETSSAKSGTAIILEMSGHKSLADQLETRFRGVDVRIVNALRSTFNGMLYRRELSLEETEEGFRWTPNRPAQAFAHWLIPSGSIEIRYPRHWHELERQQIRKELDEGVKAGREFAETLWLLDHGIEDDGPNGPNFLAASEHLTNALAAKMSRAAQGYDLRPETCLQLTQATVDAEETLHDIPDDVARAAAKGLSLRSDTGLGPNGWTAQGKRLLARARQLNQQTPMLIGAVRELSVWLETHAAYATEPATPTTEWVTWLTQGGDAAVNWTASILVAPAAQPAQPAQVAA